GPFLWLSGRDVHLDVTACLKAQGITVKRQVVYHADGLLTPYQVVQDHLLSEQPAAVIVFSARTLEQFQLWLAEYAPTAKPVQLTVLAASAGLAEQARAAGYPAFEADSPDRQAVLQLCVDWFQQKFVKKSSQKLT
ncbi:MAG: uroporphyrinogen-III synthase, partial [Candidatus Puniceispirillaceae bacterium]